MIYALYNEFPNKSGLPESAWALALSACGDLTNYTEGKRIHDLLSKNVSPLNNFLFSSLITMYSKSGHLDTSLSLFNETDIKSRDLGLWNTMIAACGHHGKGVLALELFNKMTTLQSNKPDNISFITILNSCSHSGMINEATEIFEQMKSKYNFPPTVEHYTCIVDLLGRGGRINEAEKIITNFRKPVPSILYKTLLGACRVRNDLEKAEQIGKILLELEPNDSSVYILLANIYARNNLWEKSLQMRELMQSRGVKKIPGISMIELNGIVHKFVVEDRSHPQTIQIYEKLNELYTKMKLHGHKPDTNWVLHNVEEDAKEIHLCYHSEKIAIAFGLLNTPPNTTIVITKNLRVCGDCHNATKLLSLIENRTIIVRDANRFHHFANGKCSCND